MMMIKSWKLAQKIKTIKRLFEQLSWV